MDEDDDRERPVAARQPQLGLGPPMRPIGERRRTREKVKSDPQG
jgi:hypothetical protein